MNTRYLSPGRGLYHLLLLVGLLLGLGLLANGWATPAHAATPLAVSTCDEATLAAAISQANSDNAGDTITFACSGDITLTKTLTISGSMTLDGSGQTVTLDGGNSTQVLSVNSGVSFTLNALTIAHGSATSGGGLLNQGTVTISNSTFSGNSATGSGGFGGFAGGLFNASGTVNISNSTFSGNSAANGAGGGLHNDGTVNISNSTFSGNSAGQGGGLNNGGTVTISNSTFSGNSAANGAGGGLFSGAGTVTISNSTFSDNSAANGEGAGLDNLSTLTISNSTFSGNSAGQGGGLVNGSAGAVTISNSTFSANSAGQGAGLENSGTVNIGGSIVAENTGGNCANIAPITDGGYNLSSDSSCSLTGTGSVQNTDPKLGPLASNGGPTQTMALQPGSPAIDAIPLSANICPSTDQRGDARPNNAETTCDMGAYESSYDDDLGLTNMPANITVNATSQQGASVTYTLPTVVDEDSPLPPVSCTPASGSTFALGTTTVTCTVKDSDDTPSLVSQSFTVTVNDADLGLMNMPATITTDATSPQGATVTYTLPTVVNEDSPLPSANCSPASGSTFAIGTTTVTCTVSDSDDVNSPVSASFQVVVIGASDQVSALINLVNSFHLSPQGIQASFDTQLQAVQADLQANNTTQACSDLASFISHAQAQSGQHLTVSQANQLIAAAQQIQAVLGC